MGLKEGISLFLERGGVPWWGHSVCLLLPKLSSGCFPQERAKGTSFQQQDESRQSHACGQNSFLLWMLLTQEGEEGLERKREKFIFTEPLDRKDHFWHLQTRNAFSWIRSSHYYDYHRHHHQHNCCHHHHPFILLRCRPGRDQHGDAAKQPCLWEQIWDCPWALVRYKQTTELA